ncbi:unannotated protein [freshwater metagenome]|uniref:Unannotated protein n=1 Tax=freshwater metagenome TaxID=449393 RepID=A0A6J6KZR1_9ZZZZ
MAEYPAFSTILIKSVACISAGAKICAVSVAKFTVARTPFTELSAFSTVFTHDEHVIPSIERVVGSRGVLMD